MSKMKFSFRVINEDISSPDRIDVIGQFDTLEDALQCGVDNYFFSTSIEQWIFSDCKWKCVAINGQLVSI